MQQRAWRCARRMPDWQWLTQQRRRRKRKKKRESGARRRKSAVVLQLQHCRSSSRHTSRSPLRTTRSMFSPRGSIPRRRMGVGMKTQMMRMRRKTRSLSSIHPCSQRSPWTASKWSPSRALMDWETGETLRVPSGRASLTAGPRRGRCCTPNRQMLRRSSWPRSRCKTRAHYTTPFTQNCMCRGIFLWLIWRSTLRPRGKRLR